MLNPMPLNILSEFLLESIRVTFNNFLLGFNYKIRVIVGVATALAATIYTTY